MKTLLKLLMGVLMALLVSGAWCAEASAHGHVSVGGAVFIGPGWYGPYYDPWYGYPGGYPYYYPPPNYGWLRTNIEPNKAEVWVDGRYSGHAKDYDGPVNHLQLPVGDHSVEFRMPGYQLFSTDFKVNPGGTTVIEYDLLALPSSGQAGYGVLTIKVMPPGAEISVDGKRYSTGGKERAAVSIDLPVGTHQVELSKDGYTSYYTEANVTEGGVAEIEVTLGREAGR